MPTDESIWWEVLLDKEKRIKRFWFLSFWILVAMSFTTGGLGLSRFFSTKDAWVTALDSVHALDSTLIASRARVNELFIQAQQRDTILVTTIQYVDSTTAAEEAKEEAASREFDTAIDSLRARVDSTGSRLLDQIVSADAREDSSKDAQYDALVVQLRATESSLNTWRMRSLEQDITITTYDAREEQHVAAEESMQREIDGLRRSQSITRKIALGLAVAAGASFIFR